MKQTILWLSISTAFLLTAFAPSCRTVQPDFSRVDTLMQQAVCDTLIPGGVVCVVKDTGIVFIRAYGNRQVYPDTLPMTDSTLFDLASLSKPVSIASAVHRLAQMGKVDFNAPVSRYIPDFEGNISVMHLLTHTSGLPPYANAKRMEKLYGAHNPEGLLDYICHCPRDFEPGTDVRYSCLNFITLQHIIERVTGQDLRTACHTLVFDSLGMTHTDYCPDTALCDNIAPTEFTSDSVLLKGVVHDPLARVMNNGLSGNAGLFSNAHDLARLAQHLLQHKDSAAVLQLTTVPDSLSFSYRTPGWQINNDELTYTGTRLSNRACCHTGYTGTSMIVDPVNNLAVIILTNRVHPVDKGNVSPLRGAVTDAVADALRIKPKEHQY